MAAAPEHDLATLRNAELDALFDIVFSDYEADLSRFPFRAHVFRRSGTFEVEKLEMVYSYRTFSTDPDREISFLRYKGGDGEGLVWQCCQNDDVRFFRREEISDTAATFHLRGDQDSATRGVVAVLALPLRPLLPAKSQSSEPIGVLAFDALSTEAADSLEQLFNQFSTGQQHDQLAAPLGVVHAVPRTDVDLQLDNASGEPTVLPGIAVSQPINPHLYASTGCAVFQGIDPVPVDLGHQHPHGAFCSL